MELDARGRRLRAALAAVLVKAHAPELKLMHELFDGAGIELLVVGMAHQGYDLQRRTGRETQLVALLREP